MMIIISLQLPSMIHATIMLILKKNFIKSKSHFVFVFALTGQRMQLYHIFHQEQRQYFSSPNQWKNTLLAKHKNRIFEEATTMNTTEYLQWMSITRTTTTTTTSQNNTYHRAISPTNGPPSYHTVTHHQRELMMGQLIRFIHPLPPFCHPQPQVCYLRHKSSSSSSSNNNHTTMLLRCCPVPHDNTHRWRLTAAISTSTSSTSTWMTIYFLQMWFCERDRRERIHQRQKTINRFLVAWGEPQTCDSIIHKLDQQFCTQHGWIESRKFPHISES